MFRPPSATEMLLIEERRVKEYAEQAQIEQLINEGSNPKGDGIFWKTHSRGVQLWKSLQDRLGALLPLPQALNQRH